MSMLLLGRRERPALVGNVKHVGGEGRRSIPDDVQLPILQHGQQNDGQEDGNDIQKRGLRRSSEQAEEVGRHHRHEVARQCHPIVRDAFLRMRLGGVVVQVHSAQVAETQGGNEDCRPVQF
jgi:hypothetical protein